MPYFDFYASFKVPYVFNVILKVMKKVWYVH